MHFLSPPPPDQRLDLCKLNPSDSDAVRGQIVGKAENTDVFSDALLLFCHNEHALTFKTCSFPVSLQTRDRIGSGGPVVDCRGLLENDG